jgi:hypothetical protein
MEIASSRIDPVNHHSSFDFSAMMMEMLPAAYGIELGHPRNGELSEIEQYSGFGVWAAAKRRENAARGASRGWSRERALSVPPKEQRGVRREIPLGLASLAPLGLCRLLLKRMLFVMLFLTGNIFCHCRDIRPDTKQHVNVIGGAVDDKCGSAHFADDASEVGKQIVAELWLDERTPALCAENHMQQDVGRCMRQSLSPRWGCPFLVADPRLTPWAAFLRRFAASYVAPFAASQISRLP